MGKNYWTILVRAIAFLDIFNILAALQAGVQTSDQRGFVTFHILRLVVVILASLIAHARRNESLYIPVLSEMTDKVYWRAVFFLLIVLRVPFLQLFQFGGLFNLLYSYFLIIFTTLFLFNLALFYHQRVWARKYEEARRARIEELRIISHLSRKELARVEPILIEVSGGIQKKIPVSYRATQILLALIGGVIINLLSGDIVDALINSGLNRFFNLP